VSFVFVKWRKERSSGQKLVLHGRDVEEEEEEVRRGG